MADVRDLPLFAFGDFAFPVEEYTVKGGVDKHTHKYPRAPGGPIEKLGRKNYEITCVANFQNTLHGWENLWPDTLTDLRRGFENQETKKLVIPTIGTMQALCIEWDQKFEKSIFSGEKANFKFEEDNPDEFFLQSILIQGPRSVQTLTDEFRLLTQDLDPQPDLVQRIVAAADEVFAAFDQADLYTHLIEGKVLALATVCQEADHRLDLIKHPENHHVLEALKNLWESANELRRNLLFQEARLVLYEVKRTMSVQEVAIDVYGDTERSMEILAINPIEDALEIPQGTKLRIYEEAA